MFLTFKNFVEGIEHTWELYCKTFIEIFFN